MSLGLVQSKGPTYPIDSGKARKLAERHFDGTSEIDESRTKYWYACRKGKGTCHRVSGDSQQVTYLALVP
jgi:hypothetical protein